MKSTKLHLYLIVLCYPFFIFEKYKNINATMIIRATVEDVSDLNKLINSAYRGESSKKGWTTEANSLEGKRTTETELIEIIQDKKNTIIKY